MNVKENETNIILILLCLFYKLEHLKRQVII
jgi:hypothetical protein